MKIRFYVFSAIFLCLVSLALIFYKIRFLNFPLLPSTQTNYWNIEAKVSFIAQGKGTQVSTFIPRSSEHFAVMDENFISRGFGYTVEALGPNREIVWSVRRAIGKHELYYKATVRKLENDTVTTNLKAPTFEPPLLSGAELAAVQAIVSEISAHSIDNKSLIAALAKKLSAHQTDDSVSILLGKRPSAAKHVAVAVTILQTAGIAARQVHGIRLDEDTQNAELLHWIEVFEEKRWKPYSILSYIPEIDDQYFPWFRTNDTIGHVKDGDNLTISIATQRIDENALQSAVISGEQVMPLLVAFSPFSLPVNTQAVYKIILLIPIGAFIVAFLRTIIGLDTFGTFMPVLIALAFRETRLTWGIIFFTLIISAGLITRFWLERLKLLLVPRLAAVLIIVVIIMLLLSITTHKLDIERGLSVALFPMIIITMTIERMSIVWEELGATAAIRRAIGSLASASLIYLMFVTPQISHLVFVFPEVLLIILAFTLLLGRYTGYRLMELKRFKAVIDR